jgi:glycosyltransferase involved in cell wall biosynthesis
MGTTVPVTVRAFLAAQAHFISEHGWQVHIVTSPDPGLTEVPRDVVVGNGVFVHEIPMERNPSPLKDLIALTAWVRLLRKIKPQVVMVGTPKAALLGMLSSRALRTEHRVYLVRGLRLEGLKGVRAAVSAVTERMTCTAATDVVCVSKSLETAMVQRRLVSPAKVRVLGHGSSNGVDVGRFRPPSAAERLAARGVFDIDEEAIVVGFAGRLTQDKGVEDLLAAIAIVHADHPGVRLLIAGEVDDGVVLPEAARDELRDSCVIFAGRVDNMVSFYQALDVFCLPSHREGLPNVNLEAAACGLPVVTTSATGCVDSVLSGSTGIVVAPRDPRALAQALTSLVADSGKRQLLGREGRAWVERSFRQEFVWEQHLQFLNSLIPELRAP